MTVTFNEDRTYVALVKLEADSTEHAEQLLRGGLSAAFAVGSFPTTYDVLCAVEDGGATDAALVEALEDVEDAADGDV